MFKQFLFIVFQIFLIHQFAFSQTNPSQEKRLALVIGNSDYKFAPPLENPKNDARDMCATLRKLNFEVFCHENQKTKREMKDAVIRFSEKLSSHHGVALFFYAGHGMQVKGENYLIPTDVELKTEADIEDETLNVSYLMAQLDYSKNPFNIIVLDACRNNPVSRGWRSVSRGLAPLDAPTGSVILFSTAPGKEAFDGKGRNGLFTKHLLNVLPTPSLSLEEMIKQVSRGVIQESGQLGISQTPWWNSSFTGKFCFAGCDDPAQSQELERIRKEKEQLEAATRRAQQESQEKQRILAEQEAQFKAKQQALEAQMKQLEAASRQSSTGQAQTNQELASSKKNLEALQTERLQQQETQRQQQEEIKKLDAQRKALEQKVAENEAMGQRLLQLEREKAEKERLLEIERTKKRASEEVVPQATPTRSRNFYIPPAL